MGNSSQKQILKASGIVGGSQIFIILMSIIKTKVAALLLGPNGIGIVGIFQSVIDLIRNGTSFGINYSGVREIADANNSGDDRKIYRSILVLRRWSWATGLLGLLITLLFCIPLSKFSFSNNEYALSIAILSVIVLSSSISAGQIALLQGLRQISKMAKANIWGALCSLIISVFIYYLFGIKGIVPVMIASSLITLLLSSIYSRTVKIEKVNINFHDTFLEGIGMAKLGFFIIAAGFLSNFTLYFIRAVILSKSDLSYVGFFQSAWVITNTYIGIILNSMLADFYPRLSAINKNYKASNKLINEQIEIALLIGMTLIIALIGAAPLITKILYSASFGPAIDILIWQLSGGLFIFLSWALGVTFLTEKKGLIIIFTEIMWDAIYLLTVYLGWDRFGFLIMGYAFLIANILKLLFVYPIVSNLTGFKFSKNNIGIITVYGISTILIVINSTWLGNIFRNIFSATIILVTCIYGLNKLNKIINMKTSLKMVLNKFMK